MEYQHSRKPLPVGVNLKIFVKMKFQIEWIAKKVLVPATFLFADFLFVSCQNRNSNSTTDIGQFETKPLADLKNSEDTTIINQGKFLFENNCMVCHAIFKTDNYLAGIVERTDVNYLKLYITKQDSLIKVKDKYAIELKRVWGNVANAHNFRFSDQQLNAIMAYLKKYSP